MMSIGCIIPARDHPQMKGDYTSLPSIAAVGGARDHPQMKGDARRTGRYQAVEKLSSGLKSDC